MLTDILDQRIEALLPAHETFITDPMDPVPEGCGVDRVFVQGRGDRIHAFRCIGDDIPEQSALTPFGEFKANWRWLVVSPGVLRANRDELERQAEALELGIIVAREGGLEIHLKAPPQPGIFIKQYPSLRKRWRDFANF